MSITELFLRFSVNYGAEWVMWLLIGLSGVSIYLMLDRAIFFFRARTNMERLGPDFGTLLSRGDLEGLSGRLSEERGVVAKILQAGVRESARGHVAAEQAMVGEKTRQKKRAERNLAVLATIGNNAPFVGLFGTVIGVLVAFQRFGADMQGGAGSVMGDISEALAATAVGLFVAIPAVAAFNAFQRSIKSLLADAESLGAMLLSSIQGPGEEPASAGEV